MRRFAFAGAVSTAALCAAVSPAWAPAAWAAEPKARVEGVEDEELREAIERAVGETSRPATSRLEVRRRARQGAQDAVALLRSEGYYGNVVEGVVEGEETSVAVIRVNPGPRFTFADARLTYVGEAPIEEARAAAEAAMGLADGEPGRAAAVLAAEGRSVAALQQRGYADAEAAPREVIVDHADRTVRPELRIAAGALVRMNGIDLTTEGRTDRDWIFGLAPWTPGEVYSPDDVAELERRLLDTGVYDSVTVALAPEPNAEGLRPVVVSLADRERHLLEVGASFSTSEGAGVEASWSRFNNWGRGDTLTVRGVLATMEQRLSVELALPHFRRPGRTLRVGAEAYNEQTDAFDRTGVRARADLEQRFGRTTFFTYGATADLAQVRELGIERNLATFALIGAFRLDRSNDPLDPRRGWRLEGRAEPTASVGDDALAYLRTTGQYSFYLPLDEGARTVLATRVRVGSILGGEIPQVPADRRFFAGGGGSVRGYEYQSVGPRRPDGTPLGGLSLLETSVEVRRMFTARIEGAVFVDAGAISQEELPDFEDGAVGVGAGVRYHLPFGPIRADVAIPLNAREGESPFQIYISIGQAF